MYNNNVLLVIILYVACDKSLSIAARSTVFIPIEAHPLTFCLLPTTSIFVSEICVKQKKMLCLTLFRFFSKILKFDRVEIKTYCGDFGILRG
jgi:hypothetical protein